jgi:hypothetical protein
MFKSAKTTALALAAIVGMNVIGATAFAGQAAGDHIKKATSVTASSVTATPETSGNNVPSAHGFGERVGAGRTDSTQGRASLASGNIAIAYKPQKDVLAAPAPAPTTVPTTPEPAPCGPVALGPNGVPLVASTTC